MRAFADQYARTGDTKGNARHTNVSPEDMLDLLLLEATLDDEARRTIDGASRSHFGEHELDDVLGLPVHPLTDIGDVGKDCLLIALTSELRGCDRVPPACGGKEGRVCSVELRIEATKELRSGTSSEP